MMIRSSGMPMPNTVGASLVQQGTAAIAWNHGVPPPVALAVHPPDATGPREAAITRTGVKSDAAQRCNCDQAERSIDVTSSRSRVELS